METRELAGKKANLAAAELAKLSRRVSGKKLFWSGAHFFRDQLMELIKLVSSALHFSVLIWDQLL